MNIFKRSCVAVLVSQCVIMRLQAAVIDVQTIDSFSEVSCSLRDAIIAANTDVPAGACNAGSGSDTINLTGLNRGSVITLNSELPTVTSIITMNGAGQDSLTISGGDNTRIVSVEDGGNLTISSLSLSNGYVRSNRRGGAVQVSNAELTMNEVTAYGSSGGFRGGVVSAEDNSKITIGNSSFHDNSSSLGGAVSSEGGELTIYNSTFRNNGAGYGGAVSSIASNTIISNSTFSGNRSSNTGGAIDSFRSITIRNSTVSHNTSGRGGAGIYIRNGALTLSNSIVAGNISISPRQTSETASDVIGYSGSDVDLFLQNNVFGSAETSNLTAIRMVRTQPSVPAFVPDNSNILATSDELNLRLTQIIRPLGDNGGSTLTYALPTFSPALDAGDNTNCPETDQRGEPRNDGLCDIGAFEGEDIIFAVPLNLILDQ